MCSPNRPRTRNSPRVRTDLDERRNNSQTLTTGRTVSLFFSTTQKFKRQNAIALVARRIYRLKTTITDVRWRTYERGVGYGIPNRIGFSFFISIKLRLSSVYIFRRNGSHSQTVFFQTRKPSYTYKSDRRITSLPGQVVAIFYLNNNEQIK